MPKQTTQVPADVVSFNAARIKDLVEHLVPQNVNEFHDFLGLVIKNPQAAHVRFGAITLLMKEIEDHREDLGQINV